MNEREQPDVFVTRDRAYAGGRIVDADRAAMNGPGVELTPERLRELARMADERLEGLVDVAGRVLCSPDRIAFVRNVRCDEGTSWRGVANVCFHEWASTLDEADREEWQPPSNQLMGIALCATAARLLGEDPKGAPWN